MPVLVGPGGSAEHAPRVSVKFCGLSTRADVTAAAEVGASYVGFVFFAKSPRNVSPWASPRLR